MKKSIRTFHISLMCATCITFNSALAIEASSISYCSNLGNVEIREGDLFGIQDGEVSKVVEGNQLDPTHDIDFYYVSALPNEYETDESVVIFSTAAIVDRDVDQGNYSSVSVYWKTPSHDGLFGRSDVQAWNDFHKGDVARNTGVEDLHVTYYSGILNELQSTKFGDETRGLFAFADDGLDTIRKVFMYWSSNASRSVKCTRHQYSGKAVKLLKVRVFEHFAGGSSKVSKGRIGGVD